MFIKSFKLNKKFIILVTFLQILCMCVVIFYSLANNENEEIEKNQNRFIKWVDFSVTSEALNLTSKLDIQSHTQNEEIQYNWIELLAYLACQNGGNFKKFKSSELDNLVAKIKARSIYTRFK